MAEEIRGITAISVSGFKSLREESRIEVRPLTILAGANSSGKSSIMQPLLLMKQTLEADYDPLTFVLSGPNVRFTEDKQFLSTKLAGTDDFTLSIQLEVDNEEALRIDYKKWAEDPNEPLAPVRTLYATADLSFELSIGQTSDEIAQKIGEEIERLRTMLQGWSHVENLRWRVFPHHSFLHVELYSDDGITIDVDDVLFKFFPTGNFKARIRELIHVPGFRGSPSREYPVTSSDRPFKGTFEVYVASLINHWQTGKDERLAHLARILASLGLTSQVVAKRLNDVQVEIRVGRTLKSSDDDLVSIADVGFGVSQVMPVLVALLVAEPGQLVYLEQPELHLHPRAQVALAQVLADAANRVVRVVAETHSSLLLLGVQTLIAEGKLAPEKVMLHWFTRDKETGTTKIDSVQPDENGAYGDWPEDFDDVQFGADSAYLDAVAARRSKQKHLQDS